MTPETILSITTTTTPQLGFVLIVTQQRPLFGGVVLEAQRYILLCFSLRIRVKIAIYIYIILIGNYTH